MNLLGIKIKMFELQLTQAKLAEKLGISTNSLNLKLNGKREFTYSELKKLTDILNVDANYFFN